jgi:hypothetical protein
MSFNNCNKIKEKKKQLRADKGAACINGAKKMDEVCAGCGEHNPEYTLEDNRLCFDCYKAEKYYWAKGDIPKHY